MKRIKHHFEYWLVKTLDVFLNLLPNEVAVKVGEGLGVLLSKVIYKRDILILQNLAHAFPEKTEAERKQIARGVWKNLGRTAVEFVRLPRLVKAVEPTIIWEGAEYVEDAMRKGTGVIMLASHFSNWEMLGALIYRRFGHFTAIARPMRNPFVDQWVLSKRSGSGTKVILHRQAVKASLKWIKEKNIIGILVDQNLYTGGEFVTFFGRPAATTTLPALLHSRTNAPVIITYSLREGATFRAVFEPPIPCPVVPEGEDPIRAHTQAISDRFEEIIRRHPENWFWIHNRWKRKV